MEVGDKGKIFALTVRWFLKEKFVINLSLLRGRAKHLGRKIKRAKQEGVAKRKREFERKVGTWRDRKKNWKRKKEEWKRN